MYSGIAREFLAKALIVVVNVALACKSPICSHLFLLCHHPCITRGCRKDIIWKVEINFFYLCAMWTIEKSSPLTFLLSLIVCMLVKKHHPQYSTIRNKLFLFATIITFFLLTCIKWVQAVTKKLGKEERNVTNILAFNLALFCQVKKNVLPSFNYTMILHYQMMQWKIIMKTTKT